MSVHVDTLSEAEYLAWEAERASREAAQARLSRTPDGDWYRIDAPSARRTQIIREVCAKYRLTYDELMTRTHKPALAHPRQELMYRLITECGWSQPRCGQFFNKHHTTCLYGARAHARRNDLPMPKKGARLAA